MEKRVAGEEEFLEEARRFCIGLSPREEGATLITLSGELGAGKTTFVKGVARALGITEEVTSPTFVLLKRYVLPDGPFKHLVHVDAYRLSSGKELLPLHVTDVLSDCGNLIMLEWPENVKDALPPPAVSITITVADRGGRTITYA